MSFINLNYTIYIIISFIVFFIISLVHHKKFFNWINSYWFLKRTFFSYLTNTFYYLAVLLLLISLLDLRGPEKKIKGNLPDQKTIIMVDASLSMLSEDVRPNRFLKAIQLARHFVKSSAGHQLSIVLFSDTQKSLIPFTDDIDLIDSRLAALEKTNSVGGGSNISQAVSEAVGYFENEDDKGAAGNILLFTDAEESDGDFKLSVPNSVNLAVVGIGTAKGGNIPLRYEDGSVRGYKQKNSEQVVTKLNESYIKNLGKDVKNYSFWIVNSYSLPTDEILNFFRATYNKANGNGDMRIRPVYSHLILIPAIALYCLSVLFGRFNTFKSSTLMVLFLLSFSTFRLHAEESKKPLSEKLQSRLEKMKKGESSKVEILKTAEELLREERVSDAEKIYSEYSNEKDDEKVKFNHATTLLKAGKIADAIPLAQELLKNSNDELLKSKLRKNISIAVSNKQENNQKDKNKDQNQDKENKKDQKEDDKNKDQENKKNQSDKQDDKKNNEKNSGQNKESDKGKSSEQSNKKDSKDNKNDKDKKDKDEKNKDNKDNKDKNKKDDKGEDEKTEDNRPSTLEEKEKQIELKRKMSKIPGMVKQILNDDRELQKKLMDTSTKEKGELRPKNDW